MKVFAFHIQKGGVGKTTSTGNIGYELSLKNKKVLFLDMDASQGSLTTWCLSPEQKLELEQSAHKPIIGEILNKRCDPKKAIIQIRENLYIVPTLGTDSSLKNFIESELYKPENYYIIDELLAEYKEMNLFDYIIIDMSPSFLGFEKTILRHIDEVIHPLEADSFSIEGISIFNKVMEESKIDILREKSSKKPLMRKLILANKINKTMKRHAIVIEQFKKINFDVFLVPQDTNIGNAIAENLFLSEYKKDSRAVSAYNDLANYIIGE